ncbi:S24 family peptidase [Sphingomonas oligophenolica]|uniref:LexA family transcriptional regulator n=1 Tax=Sphingomonas oligophenolica TaxID=301154 RepID=A0A502CJ18_9SPHN|nr:S24 family peptidase [Sphingomonas oligophenolica]TPG12624.1 LexA family transcriptional regulator [Sphingomonas oligophenolica]
MAAIDPRARLRELAAARGDSLAALSAMLGRNLAYLQQFVTRGSPRRLADDDRQRLSDYFGVDPTELGGEAAPAGFAVPRLAIGVSAGAGAFVDEEVTIGATMLDPRLARELGLREGQAGIVRVRGTSMEPGLIEGDLIVVDQATRSPGVRGEVHVIRVDGVTMVKRVRREGGRIVASSDNPAAPPVAGTIEVIGKVVWLMRAPR